jgi:hypothetical protein
MNWTRIKNYMSVGLINLLILILILGLVEVGFRLNFEEFKDHIHTSHKTLGKNHITSNFYGYESRTSVSVKGQIHNSSNKLILILGDSVSGGYGHAYHDIWWSQLQRLLQIKDMRYDFKSVIGFGKNFENSISDGMKLVKKLEQDGKKPHKIIYQFNFNDIHIYDKEQLGNNMGQFRKFSFAKWRYEHLNKSVFARVMQHYAGILHRNTSGTCEERAYDALGQYSWTFGSKIVRNEAQDIWKKFEESISKFNNFLSNKDIEFEILIAPILFQIDKEGVHPYYNHINLDFKCATINPIKYLLDISIRNNIKVYNPINYVRSMFVKRIEDNNFEQFYFAGDNNHFTPIASSHIAEFIAANWTDDKF